MGHEVAQYADAAIRDVPRKDPEPSQDCTDIVHIALFFDGTGNNREEDEADQSWSNVARIYEAALAEARRGTPLYPIYISGVGTTFNKKATSWLESASIWFEDKVLGLGAGGGGDRRMSYGGDLLNERLRSVMLANAKRLGGEVGAYAERSKNKSFEDVHEALSKHRLVKRINISVFGFSRGAALSRAFANRMVRACEANGSELLYKGIPLRVCFLGLFDTVASFGFPAQNVQTPFSERDLIVPKEAERCVHYVAAHELRYSFPVDLIRKDGTLQGDWSEVVYPGVHSDVGGGYKPNDQGIDNNYARKPMRDMMREALLSGVRIMPYEEIEVAMSTIFTDMFEYRAATEEALRHYLAAAGSGTGTVEDQVKRHLEVYYSAYGTMHRQGIQGPGDRQRAASFFKSLGPKGLASTMQIYREAAESEKMVRIGGSNPDGYAQYVKPEQWQVDAWDNDAPANVVNFVSTFIHDSKVDFLGNIEPFHYFRLRVIQESSVSIWREASDWIDARAVAAKQGAERMIEAGISWIKQTADGAARAADRLRDKLGDIF